ncbi:MAG: hypothetical protein GF381_04480 [Candidatus Pacebacteria bacterium]|nr:hypothetical protein [Candidatus Paceibacterota bacterium]
MVHPKPKERICQLQEKIVLTSSSLTEQNQSSLDKQEFFKLMSWVQELAYLLEIDVRQAIIFKVIRNEFKYPTYWFDQGDYEQQVIDAKLVWHNLGGDYLFSQFWLDCREGISRIIEQSPDLLSPVVMNSISRLWQEYIGDNCPQSAFNDMGWLKHDKNLQVVLVEPLNEKGLFNQLEDNEGTRLSVYLNFPNLVSVRDLRSTARRKAKFIQSLLPAEQMVVLACEILPVAGEEEGGSSLRLVVYGFDYDRIEFVKEVDVPDQAASIREISEIIKQLIPTS